MENTFLNTVTFSQMTDLIRKKFVAVADRVKPAASPLFITDNIGKGQGNTKRYDEIDTETFARRKREGEAAKKTAVGVGYNVTMTKKRIALEIDITQEMRDENRYAEVGTLITDLTQFCPERVELDMTHILTFGTATSMVDMDGETVDLTVGDGLALFSTAHTCKFSSTTYSNRVSGDPVFSRGGLESALNLATTNIVNNFGNKRVMRFNTIITSEDPNTCMAVKQFLNSVSDVDQNNSGVINVYKGKFTHIELPYLATTATGANDSTKRRYWFLASIGMGAKGWQAYYGIWEAAHLKPVTENGSRDIWTHGVRQGYGVKAVSGRGIIGSFPTSN